MNEHLTVHGRWRFARVPVGIESLPDDAPEWGEWAENLIVAGGDNLFAAFINGEGPALGTIYIAVGTNGASPTYADTQLGTENARVAMSANSRSNNVTTLTGLFGTGVANATLLEAGVFVNGSGTVNSGTMLNHALISELKTSAVNLLAQCQLTIA